jgi:GntR family transcriptional regulator/MocR family aminotransferase
LAAALQAAFGERVVVELASGGMHLLARFPEAEDDTVLARRAGRVGLAATALSSLAMAHHAGQGLLLSFTNVAAGEADGLVGQLAGVVG